MGFSVSILEGSIFPDFLGPGLFLFLVNGLGTLIGALLSFTKNRTRLQLRLLLGQSCWLGL